MYILAAPGAGGWLAPPRHNILQETAALRNILHHFCPGVFHSLQCLYGKVMVSGNVCSFYLASCIATQCVVAISEGLKLNLTYMSMLF